MTGKPRVQSTLRVAGHGLLREGWPYGDDGIEMFFKDDTGRGKCKCGAMSEPVETIAARRRWHREHKEAMKKS